MVEPDFDPDGSMMGRCGNRAVGGSLALSTRDRNPDHPDRNDIHAIRNVEVVERATGVIRSAELPDDPVRPRIDDQNPVAQVVVEDDRPVR